MGCFGACACMHRSVDSSKSCWARGFRGIDRDPEKRFAYVQGSEICLDDTHTTNVL